MQFATILLFASLALTGFAAPNAKRTVAQVEEDIATISTAVDVLDVAINRFFSSGGSLFAALPIHAAAVTLRASIDMGTTDVEATATPISEPDGRMILAALQDLEPKILGSLSQALVARTKFAALLIPAGPIVLEDLKVLQASTLAFEAALIAATPADLKAQASPIKARIDAGFNTVIAAYS